MVRRPNPVQRYELSTRLKRLVCDPKQLQRLLIVQMMQNAQGENNVKGIPLRERELADPIADELCLGKALAGLLDVFRTGIESYILGGRQVGNNSPRTASNLQNPVARLGADVFAHKDPAAFGSTDHIKKQLVGLW